MVKFFSEYYILIVTALTWVIAQIFKLSFEMLTHKRVKLSRVIGAGGMPSVHTATVIALAVAVGKKSGVSSASFAIAVVISFVVMYDAINVRQEAGKHAKVLNTLVNWLVKDRTPDEDDIEFEVKDKRKDENSKLNLEEQIGHTIIEVLCGAAIGLLVSLLFPAL